MVFETLVQYFRENKQSIAMRSIYLALSVGTGVVTYLNLLVGHAPQAVGSGSMTAGLLYGLVRPNDVGRVCLIATAGTATAAAAAGVFSAGEEAIRESTAAAIMMGATALASRTPAEGIEKVVSART